MINPVLNKQNDSELIKLLKASTVAYTKAKYWETKITYFLIALAFAYPISFVFIQSEKVKLFLFGCSFMLTVLVQLFYNTFKGNTSKGALFKEEFDVLLFGLPWKSTLAKVDHKEVSKLSTQYKGTEIENWYSTKLSTNIPKNIAIAVCQCMNTGWDIDLRKYYLNWLKGFLIIYSVGLAIFFVVMNVDGLTMFSIGFSILSFYIHFFTIINGHLAVITKREAISKKLENDIINKKEISISELRDIQDEIFITRNESAKVPNSFFKIYKHKMNQEYEDYIETINRIYE